MVKFDYEIGRRQGRIITDDDTLALIRNHFSVKNEAASHAKRMGKRFVKDRKYAITPTGLFDFGLYNEIRKFLIQSQITDIKFTENFKNHLKVGFGDIEIWDGLKYEQRYYQKETVKECLKYGRGTCILATSAGKSLVQAVLVENFKKCINRDFKCLIIVPGLSLVSQLNNDFTDYGVTFTHSGWTGDTPLQDTQVVICNSENFSAQFGSNPWIVDVDMVIGDECFSGNVKVMSRRGEIPIRDIKIGDEVWSKNTEHKFEWKKVSNVWKNLKKSHNVPMLKLTLNNNRVIEVTENHEFYTKSGKVAAKNLTVDHELIEISECIHFMSLWSKYINGIIKRVSNMFKTIRK